MSMLDGLLHRLFRRPLQEFVRAALQDHVAELHEGALYRYLLHGDPSRLHIDPTAVVNNALFNVSSGDISVGPYAFFGHNVSVLTGTHDIDLFGRQRQLSIPKAGRDVVIGEGAWLASEVLVLGPAVIGAHSVVGAGSLVHRDVEPYAVVAGRPAKLVRKIQQQEAPDP